MVNWAVVGNDTVWPVVIEVEDKFTSAPDVLTDMDVITTVPELSLTRAVAAAPVLEAVALMGVVRARMPLETDPQGSLKVSVTKMVPKAVVPISMYPAPEPPSIRP